MKRCKKVMILSGAGLSAKTKCGVFDDFIFLRSQLQAERVERAGKRRKYINLSIAKINKTSRAKAL